MAPLAHFAQHVAIIRPLVWWMVARFLWAAAAMLFDPPCAWMQLDVMLPPGVVEGGSLLAGCRRYAFTPPGMVDGGSLLVGCRRYAF